MRKNELTIVAKNAQTIFQVLRTKYPGLKGQLVFSSAVGQCELIDDLINILKIFPQMVRESDIKKYCLKLIAKEKEAALKVGKPEKELPRELKEFENLLSVDKEVFIEIRFTNPNLDVIFNVKNDPLVSKHTQKTKASIRVVLGTVEELFNFNNGLISGE